MDSLGRPTVAVIDIGASAVRMVIAEITTEGKPRVLESLHKPVRLGSDVFDSGEISKESMLQTVEILKGYLKVMQTYGVTTRRAIATSAIRESADRDAFVDRVLLRTGIEVEVIEGVEENLLTFLAVQQALNDHPVMNAENCLIIDVGAGSTELSILERGQMRQSVSLELGSVRIREELEGGSKSSASALRAVRRRISSTIENIQRDWPLRQLQNFVAVGGEARFVARQIPLHRTDQYTTVERHAFQGFIDQISKLSNEQLVHQFGLSYAEAEILVPAVLIFSQFLELTAARELVVPRVGIRDGILHQLALLVTGQAQSDVSNQIITSAINLGHKYRFDEKHALQVTNLALRLFDELKEDHGLGITERILLQVAGILHDIGLFIGSASHHKHGQYLIAASEIFGLRKRDLDIVSNVVRYHRKVIPNENHLPFAALSQTDRVIVLKLSALLRVADALDRSHQQLVQNYSLERTEDELLIHISDAEDLSLEKAGLESKGNLFEHVYGLKPLVY